MVDADYTPKEVAELLVETHVQLIDVREPVEWDINRIHGAQLVPKSTIESGENPPKITECTAPMRAQASRAMGSSGVMPM